MGWIETVFCALFEGTLVQKSSVYFEVILLI